MLSQQRLTKIQQILTSTFTPTLLTVTDESHKHIGHPGAKDGKSHFAITIASAKFANRNLLQCHRMIYAALGELFKTDIHALKIKIV